MSNETGGYLLKPGYIYITKGEELIKTVLGTCVAVCLWDRKLRLGGMTHFSHPYTKKKENATAKYGNVATSALLKMMEKAGSRREDIKAQIFGGGCPENESNETGLKNIAAARTVLKRKGISLESEDIGGSMGRKIVFDTKTGQVAVLKVRKIRHSDWFPEAN